MPLGIIIPGTGPGTGPIIPRALYSLGVDDYAHRWDAARIAGALGSLVTSWPDSVASPIPLANAAATVFTLAEESGARYVHKATGATGALTAAGGVPTTGPYTVVALVRVDPGNLNAASRNFLSFNGMNLYRAANGVFGLTGPGGSATAGSSTGAWAFVAFGVDAHGATFDDGGFVVQTNASRATALANASQVITPTTSGSIAASVSVANIDADYNTLIVWNRRLSNAELDTVRAAIIANSPLI